MRLELGGPVDCSDGTFGELADVVIDPTTKRVTHLVVKAQREPWVERLVPVELVDPGDPARRAVTLRVTAGEVRAFPRVQEVAYLQLGDFPLDDPDWDVGIQEVYALLPHVRPPAAAARFEHAHSNSVHPPRVVDRRRLLAIGLW